MFIRPYVLVAACSLVLGVSGKLAAQTRVGEFEVYPVIQADVSPRLSAISQHVPPQARANMTRFLGHIEDIGLAGGNKPGGGGSSGPLDGALQPGTSGASQYTPGNSRDGVGQGFPNFTVQWAPPDTNMAVGPNHYVQWVNGSYAIFKKSDDSIVLGPLDGNTPWSGWTNACATNNDGDPIVQYDRKYDRWIFTQFSISTKPYLQCVAVSTSGDPTGNYFRFAINFGNSSFPDYPKLGIWPTGYFMSFNVFKGNFVGPNLCAVDRSAAVNGVAPTVICKQLSSSAGSVLPADQDGPSDPGFSELFMGFGSNALNAWTFSPNFLSPASSVVTQLPSLPVPTFSQACGGGACIPQLGTSETLDSLGDRMMYRLAYRKVGTTHYLVATHSVSPNKTGLGVAGIRWYQLTATVPATGTTPVLSVTQASNLRPGWQRPLDGQHCYGSLRQYRSRL